MHRDRVSYHPYTSHHVLHYHESDKSNKRKKYKQPLQRLATRIGTQRLIVVGVNYQESAARIERFVAAAALTFPVLLDRDGAVTRAWTRRIFPTSVLVGPDGRARQVIVGEFDWNGPQAGGLLAALLPR